MKLRLENLEFGDGGEREEAQRELLDLGGRLQAAGHDVYVADVDEEVHEWLQESADPGLVVDVLNVVLDEAPDLGMSAAGSILGAAAWDVIRAWARKRQWFRGPKHTPSARQTIAIWGPNHEVLARVELDDDDPRV